MDYTPRQLQAFAFIAERRRVALLREQLQIARLAAHGKDEAVKSQLSDWDDAR